MRAIILCILLLMMALDSLCDVGVVDCSISGDTLTIHSTTSNLGAQLRFDTDNFFSVGLQQYTLNSGNIVSLNLLAITSLAVSQATTVRNAYAALDAVSCADAACADCTTPTLHHNASHYTVYEVAGASLSVASFKNAVNTVDFDIDVVIGSDVPWDGAYLVKNPDGALAFMPTELFGTAVNQVGISEASYSAAATCDDPFSPVRVAGSSFWDQFSEFAPDDNVAFKSSSAQVAVVSNVDLAVSITLDLSLFTLNDASLSSNFLYKATVTKSTRYLSIAVTHLEATLDSTLAMPSAVRCTGSAGSFACTLQSATTTPLYPGYFTIAYFLVPDDAVDASLTCTGAFSLDGAASTLEFVLPHAEEDPDVLLQSLLVMPSFCGMLCKVIDEDTGSFSCECCTNSTGTLYNPKSMMSVDCADHTFNTTWSYDSLDYDTAWEYIQYAFSTMDYRLRVGLAAALGGVVVALFIFAGMALTVVVISLRARKASRAQQKQIAELTRATQQLWDQQPRVEETMRHRSATTYLFDDLADDFD
ncbi:hypothetical protein J8273_7891 [Carpediemonas membranifera]|uniref:Transmembrane protein n=1 Tax=Carpediemonas membranifera TaxID=201153 RepID=A0A8J6ASQ7_9EUKA|nr:hypothetical protein J8273_7891 [Carpediemonas membranifera]|eukprot:KAG9390540.1 hypothetical protein J8273_7891 [Carpediemonas membranifera]